MSSRSVVKPALKQQVQRKPQTRGGPSIRRATQDTEFPLLQPHDSGARGQKKYQQESSQHVDNIVKNTRPIRYLLVAVGRFPFQISKRPDGTLLFEAKLWKPKGLWFCITSITAIYLLAVGCYNLAELMLNFTFGDGTHRGQSCRQERMFEITVVDRHIVVFTCIWSALVHVTVSSVNLFFRRRYIAKYLTFWTKVAKIVHVDVTAGTLTFGYALVTGYLITMMIFVMLSVIRVTASASAISNMFSILMFRAYDPCLMARESYGFSQSNFFLEGLSGALLFFFFVASKALMLLFIQCCRMLVTSLRVWNTRFEIALNIQPKRLQKIRVSYMALFDDHCVLLSLIEGTDKCFSTIVESYISVQIVTVIMETYFVYRTLRDGDSENVGEGTFRDLRDAPLFKRRGDWGPGLLMLLIDFFILILVLKEAGKVYMVSREGLEVIRRKTTMTQKSDQELWFTLSMFASFTYNELALQGSGFFIFSNEFIITVLSVYLTCVVAVFQFAPPMAPDYRGAVYDNFSQPLEFQETHDIIDEFLNALENRHNLSS